MSVTWLFVFLCIFWNFQKEREKRERLEWGNDRSRWSIQQYFMITKQAESQEPGPRKSGRPWKIHSWPRCNLFQPSSAWPVYSNQCLMHSVKWYQFFFWLFKLFLTFFPIKAVYLIKRNFTILTCNMLLLSISKNWGNNIS